MTHFKPDHFSLRYSLGHLIHLVNSLKDRLLDKHLVAYDITSAQFKVLLILARQTADTPAELCRCLSLDSGAMTRMVDRLESKGLIARVRSTTDRRQVRLELTAQGHSLSEQIPQIAADAMNELTGELTRPEVDELERLLKKMLVPAGLLPATEGEQ
jgi:DNA-binding MarR family transcriptional regulator